MPRDRESVMDIVASIQLVTQYVKGMDLAAFLNDAQCQDAVIRRFEIIGEAAKRVSLQFRESFSDIPWKEMAAMRDRIIHGYDAVDFDIVWETIKQDLPPLAERLEEIVNSDAFGADEGES